MEEYIFILEQLEKLQIEQKFLKLSKKFEDKKVVLFGANNALHAICSKYDLNKYFNIIGICDETFLNENIFEYKNFKVISIQNLYFSGVDIVLNLRDIFSQVEKNLRKNNLVKKRVKIEHLLKKSFVKKANDLYFELKAIINTYKCTRKVLPILKDCCFHRGNNLISKLNYTKKLAKLSSENSTPLRVLFIVQKYETWTMQELYNKMKADDVFKVLPIIVLPDSLNDEGVSEKSTIEYFNSKGMQCLDGFEYSTQEAVMLKALKPDIIFFQQPEYIKTDFSTRKMSEYALTCFVEKDFSLEYQDKYRSNFMKDRLNNTWRIFSAHDFNFNNLVNVLNVGYSKYEEYKNPAIDELELVWSKSENIKKNRIVYVPSYSIKGKFNISKFKERQDFMYAFAAAHPEFSFVLIPDKNLKNLCVKKGIYTEDEFAQMLNKWEQLPNSSCVEYPSAIDLFKTSDLLITDSLDVAADYFPVVNPIVFIEKPHGLNLNSFGEKLYKTFYKAKTNDAIALIVENILISGNDHKAENRNLFLSKNNKFFDINSSQKIIDFIKMQLNRISTDS